MAKLTELTELTNIESTDNILINKSGSDYKATAGNIVKALAVDSVADGNMMPVTSNAVNDTLTKYAKCSNGMVDANSAFTLPDTNNGKTSYWVCNTNTPDTGFWWNIEANCSNIFGTPLIFQTARQHGGSSKVYKRKSEDSGSTWSDWEQFVTSDTLTNYLKCIQVTIGAGGTTQFKVKGYYFSFEMYGVCVGTAKIGGVAIGEGGSASWFNTIGSSSLPSISGSYADGYTTVTLTNNASADDVVTISYAS